MRTATILDELAPRTPIDRVAARVLSRGPREIVETETASGLPWVNHDMCAQFLKTARACPRCDLPPVLISHKNFATAGCMGCGNHYNATGTGERAIASVTWAWNHWAKPRHSCFAPPEAA